MKESISRDKKLINLYIVLSSIIIGNALLAEIIGVKIFSLEKLIGLKPIHLPFIVNARLDFNMSIGILMWPFVFILSDIVNEYFGKKGVRRISVIASIIIGYASLILVMGNALPPADVWLQNYGNGPNGQHIDIDFAFQSLFRQGIGIIIGSITAFLISQMVDVYAFHWLRKLTGHKQLWLRATGSTVISQVVDSFVVLMIAFYILGNYSFSQVIAIGVVQYIYKVSFAIILTPFVYLVHYIIDVYLGKEESVVVIEETDKNW